MTAIIARNPVTEGLKAMLLTALAGAGTDGRDLFVEIGSAPADSLLFEDDQGRLIDPYGIIYPLPAVEIGGSLGQPERSAPLPYQITSVGRTEASAQIMADLLRAAVTARVPGGAFLHPISTGTEMVVSRRRCTEIGLAGPSEGLWQVPDTYVLDSQAI